MDNAPSTELPSAWVERLFERLLAMYGRKFADMWGCVEIASLKATWAKALADLTPEEIGAGLARCLERDWPPTLPEFRALCRRQQSQETAFIEAVRRFPRRDGWSDPAVYWAAAAIGSYDLSHSAYTTIRARWEDALDYARRNPKPIPDEVPHERRMMAPATRTEEEERQASLEAAARVMAQWRAMNPDARRQWQIPTREPGEDEEEAA